MRSLSKYFVRQSQQLKSVSTLTHTRSPALSFVAQKSQLSSSLCVPGPHSPSRLSGGALPVGITRLRSLSLLILIRETGVRLFGGEGSGRLKQGLLKRCGECWADVSYGEAQKSVHKRCAKLSTTLKQY